MDETAVQVWATVEFESAFFLAPLEYTRELATKEEKEAHGYIRRRLRAGFPVDASDLPDTFFIDEEHVRFPKSGLKDINNALGIVVVSEKFRDTCAAFDLGQTRFHEVTILGKDKATPLDGRWFILNIGDRRKCVRRDETDPQAFSYLGKDETGMWKDYSDAPLVLSPDAPEGPDIWRDSKIKKPYFVSDRLKRAIEAARIRPKPVWKPCVIAGTG